MADAELVVELKKWRLSEAKRAECPPSESSTTGPSSPSPQPRDEATLLAVPGIGPVLLRRYGSQILGICRGRS